MILLTSTSDVLRVVTDQARAVDVHATWADLASGTVTPGRTNTPITTAATTTIVASPSAATVRTVKAVTIRNREAYDGVLVRAQQFDGTTSVDLVGVTLRAGFSLVYEEGDGWTVRAAPYGLISAAHDHVYLTPTVGEKRTAILPADVVANNATANRLKDIDSLAFPVVEGQLYHVRAVLYYTAAATGTGARFVLYGPGSVTAIRARLVYSLTTTSMTTVHGTTAYDVPAASNATSAAVGANVAILEAQIDAPTNNGRVFLRVASEVSSSAITVKAGSHLTWMRTT